MSVVTGRAQLYQALKTLRARWDQTLRDWNDPVAREFEEKFLLPLDSATTSALSVMDRLTQVLEQIRQECGEEPSDAI
jgi:hypothetical protein